MRFHWPHDGYNGFRCFADIPAASIGLLKRLPRDFRDFNARKLMLSDCQEHCGRYNGLQSWCRLLHFAFRCFRNLKRSGKRQSIATLINHQVEEEADLSKAQD